ncbi:DUF6924 domain-containing protein [Dactylosporangium sp. CS-047395]|uniref:DUF6924 domain-containing protein n=1 Tax=Dactylosporangium sp. CS-047395 TaxID=3239936 RepID=UPI003D8CA116
MTALPQPRDLTALVVRVDFSDDDAWTELQALFGEDHATYIGDPAYDGATIADLIDIDDGADEDDKVYELFLADETSMTDDEHPLLAVDLADEPGRSFRVLPGAFAEVASNLSIANMDFADFAEAVDETGTYRGRPE